MATAGRAVLLSGLTVAVGLLALVVLPVPGLRSVGYGGILIPLVSTAVTLTLLPALLGAHRPAPGVAAQAAARAQPAGCGERGAAAWYRRRWIAAAAAIAILVVLILPVFSLTVGSPSADALDKNGPAQVSYDQLTCGGIPAGVLTPIDALVRWPAQGGGRQAQGGS